MPLNVAEGTHSRGRNRQARCQSAGEAEWRSIWTHWNRRRGRGFCAWAAVWLEGYLAQAEQTLTALGAHAAVSTAHGFNASYAAMLAEARPLLEQAGVGREDARSGKKETNLAFISALRAAKAKRARARSILSAVADVLGASVADSAGEGRARATLAQTLRRG